jgi:hypothetical protein
MDGGDGGQWNCYHKSLGATDYLILNSEAAKASSSTRWNNTAPTSSVFTVSTSGDVNDSGDTHIAYCFADVAGYSKMGKYIGNGNADGTFVYTGFKPAFILMKRSDTDNSYDDWFIFDNKRDGFNPNNKKISPNETSVESTDTDLFDLLSNGFKLRTANSNNNGSGGTFVYMAFGQPIISNSGVCVTAR